MEKKEKILQKFLYTHTFQRRTDCVSSYMYSGGIQKKIANFEDYDAPKNSSHTARNEIKCSGEIEILETRICSS